MEQVGAGVVLAAGASSRMGAPKALLDDGRGRSFLEAACESLREAGVQPVFVVVGFDRERIEPFIPAGAVAVRNPEPELGQVRSMAVGLRAAMSTGRSFALVALVDHPAVRPSTARLLAEAGAREPGCVHVPVWRGQRGHPVAMPVALASALRSAEEGEGARDVIRRLGMPVREHPVEDPGILTDVDTPEELSRWRRGEGQP